MDNIAQLKEIIATLNLESGTTREIIHELMPLFWWKFVWIEIMKFSVAFMMITSLIIGLIVAIKKMSKGDL